MKKQLLTVLIVIVIALATAVAIPVPQAGAVSSVPIYDIQYTADPIGDSPYEGQTVTTHGVVTAVFAGGNSVFIQDGTGPWTGLYLYNPSDPLIMGDLVEVEGEISEYYGLTEIALGNVAVLSSGNPLPAPEVLSTGDVSQEQWESVLVRVEDVTVSNADLGYGEWEVTDGVDVALIDDMGSYTYVPSNGDSLNFVQGPLNYTFGAFKIEPRDDNDIGLRLPPVVDVNIDIKPGSASNPVNVQSKGVLPVAILGTEDFDVTTVNASTVVLTWPGITLPDRAGAGAEAEGVPPLRWALEDVNRDGFMDIGLKYSMEAAGTVTLTREASGPLDITLMGELLDGTRIEGYDTVRIINKLID